MKATAVVVDYAALTTNMGKLATLNLERARAIEQIVAWAVDEEQAKRRHVLGTGRRIESKLRAAHFCTKDAGFQQLPPSASGARSWRCLGCGKTVEL